MASGNREAAFFQAMTSAGVVVEVTNACNRDHHRPSCTCDYTNNENKEKKAGFRWQGCNDNIRFGITFAEKFLDAREMGNDARVLMNKQNNMAGRMVSNGSQKLTGSRSEVSLVLP